MSKATAHLLHHFVQNLPGTHEGQHRRSFGLIIIPPSEAGFCDATLSVAELDTTFLPGAILSTISDVERAA